MGAFVLMTKANIGLGVLSIPFVFMLVGMAPGVILLFVMNLMVMCESIFYGEIMADMKQTAPVLLETSS